jgi:glycosyltransferase involved in cell wall biosynthesis
MREQVIGFYDSTNYHNIIEKHSISLIRQLNDAGIRVMGFACTGSDFYKALQGQNIPVTSTGDSTNQNNLSKAFRLVRILKENHCELLVIIRPHDLVTAVMAKKFFYRKLKLIFFQQIKFHLRKNYLLYNFLFKPFNAWITTMENQKKQLLELSGFPGEKVFIISPGIDFRHFEEDTVSKIVARKILKLPEDTFLIGALGRHSIKNRQDFMIRAIQLLRKHNYDVDLLLVGMSRQQEEIEYFNFLQELAVECGVEDHVHFRPQSEKEITFFKALDVYTELSPFGLNGHNILKAMASNVPVIAPSSEDLDEVLDKGKYGMLYHKNDLEDFTSKIIRLITQPKIRDYLNGEARKIIHEKYNIRLRNEKFESVISSFMMNNS